MTLHDHNGSRSTSNICWCNWLIKGPTGDTGNRKAGDGRTDEKGATVDAKPMLHVSHPWLAGDGKTHTDQLSIIDGVPRYKLEGICGLEMKAPVSKTPQDTRLHLLYVPCTRDCHIHANSDTSPTCSDASPLCSNVSPTNSDVSPICSDASPTNSDVSPINSDLSPPNSYSVPPVRPDRFCHTFRYIPCFLPVTYLSPHCYLFLPCVYPFHVLLPLMCFSYSPFHMSCVYHKDPVLSVSI